MLFSLNLLNRIDLGSAYVVRFPDNGEELSCKALFEATVRALVHREIVEYAISAKSKKNSQDSHDLGVAIAIHGHNTGSADIDLNTEPKSDDDIKDGVWKDWYQKISKYINNDPVISRKSDDLVFLGYRWLSESLTSKNFSTSLNALPFLLNRLLWGSLIVGLISLFLFFGCLPHSSFFPLFW